MNRIANRENHRDAARGEAEADTPRPSRPGPSPGHFRAAPWAPAWLALALLVATGCGGGDTEEEPAAQEAPASAPPGMAGQTAAPKAKPPKKEEKAKPEEKPLPEDIAEWQKDDYSRARRERAPALIEAVAHLGEQFAGTDQADSAAQLLTNLLKKSEEPKPKSGARQQRGSPGMGGAMGPGMGSGMGMGMEPGAEMGMGPGMESGMGMEPGAEMGMGPGMEGGMPGMAGMPGMPGMGPGNASRTGSADSALIQAIVEALGVNASGTARETLTQVVEGTFETDDNRAATLAALNTLVAHLSSEYEEVLFRCLTAPEKLRPLGQSGQPGRPPAGGAYSPSAMPGAMPGAIGTMPGAMPGAMLGAGSGSGALTAEELQRSAFALIAPVASEQFRVRLAKHLASPTSPQEDHDLFGGFLRTLHPDNVAAQMVLLAGAGMDAKTQSVIQENFLACSSDALASILGVPLKHRVGEARPSSSRRRPSTGSGGMMPGMDPGMMPGMAPGAMDPGMMPGMDPGMAPGMAPGAMDPGMMPGMDPGMAPGMAPGSMAPGMMPGMDPGSMGPGMMPGAVPSGMAPAAGATGHPSRYGSRQPAGARQQPGAQREQVRKPPDPDLPYRLAKLLWGTNLPKVLQTRLSQADSLKSNAQAVLLASTVPVDSMRSTLHQLLQKHWEEGPQPLESAGLLDDVVSDPGLLALVKMLPRKAPEEEAKPTRRRPGRTRPGGRRPGSAEAQPGAEMMPPGAMASGGMAAGFPGGPGGMPGGMGQGARRPNRSPKGPGEAWMFTSEDLVRLLCKRFLAAAKAGAGAQAPAGEPGTHGLPFEVRGDAKVVAEYHLDWPGGAQAKLAGVPLGALKVHYVRTEQETKLSTLRSYYERKIDSVDTRPIPDGTWMDSFRPAPEAGWKRSLDLMFTTMVPAEEREERKDIPITLDILCIDIKDPAAG